MNTKDIPQSEEFGCICGNMNDLIDLETMILQIRNNEAYNTVSFI